MTLLPPTFLYAGLAAEEWRRLDQPSAVELSLDPTVRAVRRHQERVDLVLLGIGSGRRERVIANELGAHVRVGW